MQTKDESVLYCQGPPSPNQRWPEGSLFNSLHHDAKKNTCTSSSLPPVLPNESSLVTQNKDSTLNMKKHQ